MIQRYDRSKPGYAACLGMEDATPQGMRWTWEVHYIGDSWTKAEDQYNALKLERFSSAKVLVFRNADGAFSVEHMESNHLCILILPGKCYSSALKELPSFIEADIDEMNAAESYSPTDKE